MEGKWGRGGGLMQYLCGGVLIAIHAIESGFGGVGDEGWGVVATVVRIHRQLTSP